MSIQSMHIRSAPEVLAMLLWRDPLVMERKIGAQSGPLRHTVVEKLLDLRAQLREAMRAENRGECDAVMAFQSRPAANRSS